MCSYHWSLVPQLIRKQILATYVEGQELRSDPSHSYLEAARRAINAVHEWEKK